MEDKHKRRGVLIGLGVGSLGFMGGLAAAVGTSFSETIRVAYGDVEREESDIVITDVTTDGNGVNVDTVLVDVENSSESTISFDCDVFLMDGDTIASEGTESLSLDTGDTATITVTVPQTKEFNFDQIDVRITEQ